LKQERTILAKVKQAERVRRIREAEQAGMRQAEEILRKREEVMFRELMGTHQGTVDSYLVNIINETVRGSAQEQALEEVQLRSN
jgi:primase-polymerase (primpol)-like protein